jgi:GNAT superfamily N-acetyltransferase
MTTQSFFPNAGLFTPLLRLDRVWGLQVGYANSLGTARKAASRGPFLCLVAAAGGEGAPPTRSPPAYPRPAGPAGWLPATTWGAFGDVASSSGTVLGSVVVDLQGGHLPPRVVRAKGTTRLVPRAGLAYLSNLAVSPRSRRAGLGSALLAAAEAQAWAWGCHALALHVDARNAGAADLYLQAGFRPASRDWPPLDGSSGLGGQSGPSGQPLALMMKVRPRGVDRVKAVC